jgi:multidrug transporter EmrE-like cation transporter
VAGRVRSVLVAGVLIAAAGIVSVQLFVPPVVGVADNGDFGKIMAPAGLAYRTDSHAQRYWNWAHVKFAIVTPEPFPGWYKSSETLLALAAVDLSRLVRPGRDFDIRILGLLHAILLLAFLALLAAATREIPVGAQAAILSAAAFFYTDVGYVALFNSLYSQTASLLFLLLTIGVAALSLRRGRLEGILLPAYFGAAALFVCSKPQEFVHGPLLAVLGLALAEASWRDGLRPFATRLAIALCAASVVYYAAIPRREIREIGLYHTVFMELLPASPDPGRDLDELGLDRGLLRYSGVNAYQPEAPLADAEFRGRFFDRCGYGNVLGFYLRRPARAWDRLERAGRAAFTLRAGRPGNYSRETGFPPQTPATHFSAWSSLRSRLGDRGGIFWVAAAIAASYLTAFTLLPRTPRGRSIGWTLAVFATIAGVQFFVCAFGDYLGDVSRHLYAFQGLWDALLLANLAVLAFALSRRRAAPSHLASR